MKEEGTVMKEKWKVAKSMVSMMLVVMLFLSIIMCAPPVKASVSGSTWYRTWHKYYGTDLPDENVSSTPVWYYNPEDSDFSMRVSLAVTVYEYTQFAGNDAVQFAVCVTVDNYAPEGNFAGTVNMLNIFVRKYGSNRASQYINWVPSAWEPPGYVQGYGLEQDYPIDSTEGDRGFWSEVLFYLAEFIGEGVGYATGLIQIAGAMFGGTDSPDLINAGPLDPQAISLWDGTLYGLWYSPVSQYAINHVSWQQDPSVNPAQYYGIEVWAEFDLLHDTISPYGEHLWFTSPSIYLKINHYTAPTGCVVEGTPVTMADGTSKPIEKVKKGDQVLGYDPATGSYMAENVLNVTKTKVEAIVNINNGMLKLTPLDQPIFIRNSTYEGWMRDPANIQVGWEIYNATSNGWVPVTSITYEEGKTRVYDLVLDGYTTYIANGLLMMDKNGC